jgi:hypothetical protein
MSPQVQISKRLGLTMRTVGLIPAWISNVQSGTRDKKKATAR